MNSLDAMRVFVAVVDNQGFSSAAKILRMPPPTVSRKITELEKHLGTQLLVRSTRKVNVTDNGLRYYEAAVRILKDIEEAERIASGEYDRPKGHLLVTAPALFGRLYLLPIVNRFLKQERNVDIQLLLTNITRDIVAESIDVAIRLGRLADSSMIAVSLGSFRKIVCASPGYLSKYGRPSSPDELTEHECIPFSRPFALVAWKFNVEGNEVLYTPRSPRLVVNGEDGASIATVVDALLLHAGLGNLYAYQAAPLVADGKLEIVLEEYEPDPVPVNLVYAQRRFVPLKFRSFIDFTVPVLRDCLSQIDKQCSNAPHT